MNPKFKKRNSTQQAVSKRPKKKGFEDYSSPIKRYSFSSLGRGCSTYGLTVNREYHFLSDLERDYFDIIDFKDSTFDIKENYPLLPLESTRLIAEALNIRHPEIKGQPVIMTSDFLVNYQKEKKIKTAVRQIKYSAELSNPRVLEKFRIEENWWHEKGVDDWKIITEKQVDKVLAERIRDLKNYRDLKLKEIFRNFSEREITLMSRELKEEILGSDKPIIEIIEAFDKKRDLQGAGIRIFKHLACLKEVPFELNRVDFGIGEKRN